MLDDNYQKGIYNSYVLKEGLDINELIDFLKSQAVPENYYLRHIEGDEFSGFFRNTQFAYLKNIMVGKFLKRKVYINGCLQKTIEIPKYLKNYF